MQRQSTNLLAAARAVRLYCCVIGSGDLPEGLLSQLGNLPSIKTRDGADSDCDTDKDMGSEATDFEEDVMMH